MNIFEYERLKLEITNHGYTVEDIVISSFEDNGETFEVYTVELKEPIDDYSQTIAVEKHIKSSLGLYDKNIIIELL